MIQTACIHFSGDKPCRFRRLCDGCPHYEPFERAAKILVIKCRAQGDVLRTTALLPGLQRKYPESFISWLIDEESVDLLDNNPYIARVHPFNMDGVLPVQAQTYNVLICLDKEPGLIALASMVHAGRKFGFGMNGHGNLEAFNPGAGYALRLGIDDDLKFRQNRKTYQEIVAEAAEIDYRGDEYVFNLRDEYRRGAQKFFGKKRIRPGLPNIGLNTGAGAKFETKQWPEEHYLRLIHDLRTKLKANVFLLGGKRETRLNRRLADGSKAKVFDTGNDNSLLEFAGLISMLDLVVTSDTLGMHIAIALKKKVVALFGPTCPQEIDLYGRGVKLFKGAGCSPCYKQTCPDPVCMKGITPERVFEEIQKLI